MIGTIETEDIQAFIDEMTKELVDLCEDADEFDMIHEFKERWDNALLGHKVREEDEDEFDTVL